MSDGNPLQRTGARIAKHIERWLPDPFILAALLTIMAGLAAVLYQGTSPTETVNLWAGGFWDMLDFTMQMTLILVTAYVIARHSRVSDVLTRLSSVPNTGRQAVMFVAAIAMFTSYINWGLGLVVGGLLAREVGKRGEEGVYTVHYPLVVAAAFMGHGTMWHAGLTSAVGLMIATPGNEFEGVLDGLVYASETIFNPYMLFMVAVTFLYVLVLMYFLTPSSEQSSPMGEYVETDVATDGGLTNTEKAGGYLDTRPKSEWVPADYLNNSRLIGLAIGIPGLLWAVFEFATLGIDALNFNVINLLMISLGLVLFMSPEAYLREFYNSVEAAAGIIFQFHFYAGILGILAGSGLVLVITNWMVSVSSPETFPVMVWAVAGFVNFIIPSGGGQWIVMGEPIINAADQLGVDQARAASAFMFGDMHTNLLNPFWSLPLLGLAGVRAREVFGYCVAVFLCIVPLYVVMLLVLPYPLV